MVVVSGDALAKEAGNRLCKSKSCVLSVVGNYQYCSLAPHNFQGNDLFRSKSLLSISSGGKGVLIETVNGVHLLEQTKSVELKRYPEDEFSLAKELRQVRLTSPQGFSANYVFQGPILADPKKQHVQLSDMKLF